MNREKLIEKDKVKAEAIKKKKEQERIQREIAESENTGILTTVKIRDGGDIYDSITEELITKRIILDFKNEYHHLEFEFEVDSIAQQVDKVGFLKLYRFYLQFLSDKAFNQLITGLNNKIPELF